MLYNKCVIKVWILNGSLPYLYSTAAFNLWEISAIKDGQYIRPRLTRTTLLHIVMDLEKLHVKNICAK